MTWRDSSRVPQLYHGQLHKIVLLYVANLTQVWVAGWFTGTKAVSYAISVFKKTPKNMILYMAWSKLANDWILFLLLFWFMFCICLWEENHTPTSTSLIVYLATLRTIWRSTILWMDTHPIMACLETEGWDPQSKNEFLKVTLLYISRCSEYFLLQGWIWGFAWISRQSLILSSK